MLSGAVPSSVETVVRLILAAVLAARNFAATGTSAVLVAPKPRLARLGENDLTVPSISSRGRARELRPNAARGSRSSLPTSLVIRARTL